MFASAAEGYCAAHFRAYGKYVKAALVFAVFSGFCVCLSFSAGASQTADDRQIWYSRVWDAVDGETAALLEDIGLTELAGADGLMSLTPEKVFSSVFGIFRSTGTELLKSFFAVISVLLIVALFSALAGSGKTAEAAANVGTLVAVFIMIAENADIFIECRAAIELTKDMMLSLIPVLAGIVAFSGRPALAASFNSVVFAFAETVSAVFCNILPAVSVAGTALGAASAVAPLNRYEGLCRVISKAVNTFAAFVSGIFVAVLSVRGVIAGAADTVTVKGLRFLIGSSVPVVGSAVGDALNSVAAGLGLIKNSMLAIGVLAVVFISLPALIRLAVWSFLLYFIALFAQTLSLPRISELVDAVKSVASVLTAVTFFNAFVYIISCAILVTVNG